MPTVPARATLVAAFALALSACSGTRPAPTPEAPPVTYPDAPASETTYEPTPAPVYEPTPAPVYEPTPAPAPSTRQVNGYRVQIYASQSSAGGEQSRVEAETWWRAEQRRSGFTAPLDAYVVYLDGLYKVRMGAFTNRADAEAALQIVRTRFPDAFLAADLVTIDG